MLGTLGGLLAFASGIASLVFFIMVVMEMFKRDQKNLGIICIVLFFCAGAGQLVAFIYGWMKATEWDIKKIMTYWTVAVVSYLIAIVLIVASVVMTAATLVPDEGDFDPNNMNFEFDIDESDFDMPEFEMPDNEGMPEDTTFDEPAEATTDQP